MADDTVSTSGALQLGLERLRRRAILIRSTMSHTNIAGHVATDRPTLKDIVRIQIEELYDLFSCFQQLML